MAHLSKQLAAVQASAGSASKGMGGLENTSNQASKHLAAVGSSAKTATRGMGGLIDVLGKLGLAGMGISALAGAARGLGDALGIGLNVEMENVEASLIAFTKDGAKAKEILAQIRKEADSTPFAFNEMAKATAGLMPVAKTSGAALMDLVKQAEILAASNPAQGLEGAAFALREAVSGDFTSVIERFNLPRSYINKLKDEGVPALEIVSRAMLEMGYDSDLVSNLAKTASGRWSTFMDTIDGVKAKISAVVFDKLKDALGNMQGWLDANKEKIGEWATAIGNFLGGAVSKAIEWLGDLAAKATELWPSFQAGLDILGNLVGVFMGGEKAGLNLHNALERLLGLEVANFLIGLVQGARDLQANLGPLVDQGIKRLQQAMADLTPTGERLSKLFDAIKAAVVALVPKPLLDMVSGLGDMARKSVASGDALKTLTDVVNTVSQAIGDASKFVQEHKEVQAVLVGVLASAATAWTLIKVVTLAQAAATGIVTTVTGLWTAAQWLLNAALTANPIGIVVVALAGLAAALIYAYNNSEEFRQIVDSIATFLQNVLAFAIESVRRKFEELTGALDAVNKFQSDVLEALGELAGAALRLAGEIGDNIIQGIKNGITAGWTWLSNLVGNLAQELLKRAKAVLGISSPSKEFFRVGQFIIDGLVAGLKSRNTTLIDAITSTVGSSINLMESLIARKVGGLNASILSRGASAAESFQKLLAEKFDGLDIMFGFPNLPNIFSQISAASKDAAMVGQIKDVLDAMREMGMTIDQNVIQQFKNLGQELGGPFKEQLDKLLGSLGEQDALKGLQDFLADADLGRQLAATASQLQSLGQAMPDTLKKLLESVPRVGGGILDTIIKQLLAGAIPGFASGGVVSGPANQPVLAVVHGGERITPTGQQSGNTYYFNMTVNSQTPVDSTIANFALMRAMVGG